MKNILTIASLSLLTFGSITLFNANDHSKGHSDKQSYICAYIKQDGTQCRNYAQKYSPYCWSHNPVRY